MNISFALTTPQFKARTKTETRRLGWKDLKAGASLFAIEKGMGLKRGEKVKGLGWIKVKFVSRERLDAITQDQVIAEGFPEMTPADFIAFFCKHNKCQPSDIVTRIVFKYDSL